MLLPVVRKTILTITMKEFDYQLEEKYFSRLNNQFQKKE